MAIAVPLVGHECPSREEQEAFPPTNAQECVRTFAPSYPMALNSRRRFPNILSRMKTGMALKSSNHEATDPDCIHVAPSRTSHRLQHHVPAQATVHAGEGTVEEHGGSSCYLRPILFRLDSEDDCHGW